MNCQIAALFCRCDSVYKTLPGVDVYDLERNALTWGGGCPVVAHPPCRTWGQLRGLSKGSKEEHDLGFWAVEQVRRWGGVLEHPQGSQLFPLCGCMPSEGLPDSWGGFSITVDQFHWGHRARKRTTLYIVGTSFIPQIPKRFGQAERLMTNDHRIKSGMPGYRKEVTEKERDSTPFDFALWLVNLARQCVSG